MSVRSLKSCDTCRKAIRWLKERGIDATVMDIREIPPTNEEIARYVAAVGWEKLLNKKSTTWRQLSDADKADVDKAKAISLIVAHPTVMKRPVVISGDQIIVGFDKMAQAEMEKLINSQ